MFSFKRNRAERSGRAGAAEPLPNVPPLDTKAAPPLSGAASPATWLFDVLGSFDSATGVEVGPLSAMRATPVRCAVLAISEAVASLPIHVYERKDDGSAARLVNHPVSRLLNDAPNEFMSANELRENLVRNSLLFGNGFAWINRVGGSVTEILLTRSENVAVKIDNATGEPSYTVTGQPVPLSDVLHVRMPGSLGAYGDSPILQCREAIAVAIVLEQHAGNLFGNGARPSGMLTFDKRLEDSTAEKMRQRWQSLTGPSATGKTAVMEEGARFTPLSLNSVDAQFLELRNFSIAEIARVFRVNPIMLMDLGRATWANNEAEGARFVSYTLMPHLRRFESEATLKLLTPEERAAGLFLRHDVDELLRADTTQRAQAWATLIQSRVLSPNEARARENLPPYEGGDTHDNPNTTPARPADPIAPPAEESANG